MAAKTLSGTHHVRAISPAFDDASWLFRRTRDRMEVRRHALKLRYWPEMHPTDDAGRLLDLNWCWIRALRGSRIGELRLDDTIGGQNNLRIIFYVAEEKVHGLFPVIWILRVMQKKRNDFSARDLQTFKARKSLVIERFYRHRE